MTPADRRAGDRHRTNAQFVQRFEGDDVRYPTGASAAQRNCDGRKMSAGATGKRSHRARACQGDSPPTDVLSAEAS